MRRSRKLIVIAVVSTLALVGGITGAVLAQNEKSPPAETRFQTLLERACNIYEQNTGVAIDAEELGKALAQAANEMQTQALKDRLQSLVESGRISQEQADQFLKWWESRPPDTPLGPGLAWPGFPGLGRAHGWNKWCPRSQS